MLFKTGNTKSKYNSLVWYFIRSPNSQWKLLQNDFHILLPSSLLSTSLFIVSLFMCAMYLYLFIKCRSNGSICWFIFGQFHVNVSDVNQDRARIEVVNLNEHICLPIKCTVIVLQLLKRLPCVLPIIYSSI